MSCCICRKEVSDRKKRILLFGSTKKAVSVRNSLASYLREESNRNITEGELRGLFSEDYACVECADRIAVYEELKVKWRHAEQFMEEHVGSRIGSLQGLPQSPRRTPPAPFTSTPKRLKLQTEQSLSLIPPVQVKEL